MEPPENAAQSEVQSDDSNPVAQAFERVADSPPPFVPSLGAWTKPLAIPKALQDPSSPKRITNTIEPSSPEVKSNGQLRFPWAAKMDASTRNLRRTTSPSYMEDGTPKVHIPNHVMSQGIASQQQFIVGQFYRCKTPAGGLVHAMANRIWGKKCKISTRKLGEFSYLFHVPDESTRKWILQRSLWHFDECIMFIGPWSTAPTLALPEITSLPIWVTLKNLPSSLYTLDGISWVASGLGEPIVTFKPWLDPTLIGEAKLMVEVELDKNFPDRILAEDEQGNVSLVDVEYAWLPAKCSYCGVMGHKESRCLKDSPQVPSVANTPSTILVSQVPSSDNALVTEIVAPLAVTVVTEEATTPIAKVMGPSSQISPSSPREEATTLPSTVIPISSSTEEALVNATSSVTLKVIAPDLASSSPLESLPCLNISSTPSPSGLLTVPSELGCSSDSLEFGAFAEYETRGGRSVKPSVKLRDMEWSTVGKGKHGRGDRGGRRGRPSSNPP